MNLFTIVGIALTISLVIVLVIMLLLRKHKYNNKTLEQIIKLLYFAITGSIALILFGFTLDGIKLLLIWLSNNYIGP